ncbi:hypothetical protein J3R82DRAFT_2902 [Butyriboletus roseoflavus]|nr:hypothetical protein J3R82DRAFT_2902 [Butyriboletus roseoflavus]
MLAQLAVSFVLFRGAQAQAETHTITFDNRCGYGAPMLIDNGEDILQGSSSYKSSGPWSGIGYLQTGQCGPNGENCSLLEMTLINDNYTTTDISLIPSHQYNVETSFSYYNGCDGVGKDCNNPNCGTNNAFYGSTDYTAQAYCSLNNVDLYVAFCANASEIVLGGGASNPTSPTTGSLPTSSLPTPSSIPSLGSSTPASVSPVTPPTSTPSTIPTETPTNVSDLGCGSTVPPPPPPSSTPSQAPTSNPGSLTPSGSPTSPTDTPTTTPSLLPTVTVTPSTTPVSSAGAATSSSSAALRRRHRRTNRIRY